MIRLLFSVAAVITLTVSLGAAQPGVPAAVKPPLPPAAVAPAVNTPPPPPPAAVAPAVKVPSLPPAAVVPAVGMPPLPPTIVAPTIKKPPLPPATLPPAVGMPPLPPAVVPLPRHGAVAPAPSEVQETPAVVQSSGTGEFGKGLCFSSTVTVVIVLLLHVAFFSYSE